VSKSADSDDCLDSAIVASEDLVAAWRSAGLSEGDTVLLHSSVSRTMQLQRSSDQSFSLTNLLDTFISAVGPYGTLLLPTFNFSFCEGLEYDCRITPSMMGALTETARLDSRFLRTKHPIYSFAVAGRRASEFVALENRSALADNGPFGLLRRLRGKIAVLDLDDQNSMTMYHHIEEVMNVDYRYLKSFTGRYIDMSGCAEQRTFDLFVWDEVRNVRTDVNRAGDLLWSRGLYNGQRPCQGSGLRVINAQEMFLAIAEVISTGRAGDYLYSIGPQ
jgi:aminoglycoside 3-N-acetyltransferase